MTPDERAFVVSSFADNYRRHSGVVNDDVYRRCIIGPLEAALPLLDVKVATVPGAPDDFIGWSAAAGDTLVYVYVKKDYRRRPGHWGRSLLPLVVNAVAYPTVDGRAFLRACGFYPRLRAYALYDVLADTFPDTVKRAS